MTVENSNFNSGTKLDNVDVECEMTVEDRLACVLSTALIFVANLITQNMCPFFVTLTALR